MRSSGSYLLAAGLLLAPLVSAGRSPALEDCEVCGLITWRLETAFKAKQLMMEPKRKADEERASAREGPAHAKRIRKAEVGVALADALDDVATKLTDDGKLKSSACRGEMGIHGSVLRADAHEAFDQAACTTRVKDAAQRVLEEHQDKITEAVKDGKGASMCTSFLPRCNEKRALKLLGDNYKEGMSAHELDRLQVGYRDGWTVHEDIDGSFYFFNRAGMRSVREPPPGWIKADGKWVYDPKAAAHEDAEHTKHIEEDKVEL